jgi:hypothetical protein
MRVGDRAANAAIMQSAYLWDWISRLRAFFGGERRLQYTREASQDGLIGPGDFAREGPHRLAVGAPRELLNDDRDESPHFHASLARCGSDALREGSADAKDRRLRDMGVGAGMDHVCDHHETLRFTFFMRLSDRLERLALGFLIRGGPSAGSGVARPPPATKRSRWQHLRKKLAGTDEIPAGARSRRWRLGRLSAHILNARAAELVPSTTNISIVRRAIV